MAESSESSYPTSLEVPKYSLKPICLDNCAEASSDLPFLRELYASTRREELAPAGWPQEQVEAFLGQQFEAQHSYYQEHYQEADFDLILSADGSPAGRLYLIEWEEEFRIVDIALLPEFRGQGIGSALLKEVIAKAFACGKSVSIHVEQYNPAKTLYHRLGFEKISDEGVYDLMRLSPPTNV